MRSAGKVVNFSNRGNIILRSKEPPKIGDRVKDRRSNTIGKVIRITGPVSFPYIILSPKVEDPSILKGLLGRELFISENERPKRRFHRKKDREAGQEQGRKSGRGTGKNFHAGKGRQNIRSRKGKPKF
jgi:rRNA processing protein Gar1